MRSYIKDKENITLILLISRFFFLPLRYSLFLELLYSIQIVYAIQFKRTVIKTIKNNYFTKDLFFSIKKNQ